LSVCVCLCVCVCLSLCECVCVCVRVCVSPVQCCWRRRISACRPLSVLACVCVRLCVYVKTIFLFLFSFDRTGYWCTKGSSEFWICKYFFSVCVCVYVSV